MKVQPIARVTAAGLLFTLLTGTSVADGQLHLNTVRKQQIEVRLIALAIA